MQNVTNTHESANIRAQCVHMMSLTDDRDDQNSENRRLIRNERMLRNLIWLRSMVWGEWNRKYGKYGKVANAIVFVSNVGFHAKRIHHSFQSMDSFSLCRCIKRTQTIIWAMTNESKVKKKKRRKKMAAASVNKEKHIENLLSNKFRAL